jgi:gamma-glutamyltranspeptidase
MGRESSPPPRSRRRLRDRARVWSEKSATAQRVPVEARHGLVTSASQLASRAGVDILKRGGNAIDAVVATAFTLAVTYPRAGNLVGGGFAVLRLSDGWVAGVGFRETAPSAARRDLFFDPQGDLIPGKSTVGYAASGVPGTVAGLALAEQKYGSGHVAWADLPEPARRLAAEPFLVTGSPAGGLTIINTVLLVITNVIDHGLSVTQGMDAPRFYHQWLHDMLTHELFFTSPDSISLLKEEGYALSVRTLYPITPEAGALTWGDAETILVDPRTGMRLGANDLRSADSAAGGW